MVHSSDNEMAPYQEPDYLQVKEMVCAPYPWLGTFFGSGWRLFTVSGEGTSQLHVVL